MVFKALKYFVFHVTTYLKVVYKVHILKSLNGQKEHYLW